MNEQKLLAIESLKTMPNVGRKDVKLVIDVIKACYMSNSCLGETGCELYLQQLDSEHQAHYPVDVSRCNLYVVNELQSFIQELEK